MFGNQLAQEPRNGLATNSRQVLWRGSDEPASTTLFLVVAGARQIFPLQLQQHEFEGILTPFVDVLTEGANLEAKLIFRAATWLLSAAFFSGLAMALIRFATDRPTPPWVAKLHGFAAAGAISLLIFGWVNVSFSRPGLYGLLTLLVAAALGLFLNLGYHWKHKPLPEWMVFVHMSVAFIGFLLVGAVTLSLVS